MQQDGYNENIHVKFKNLTVLHIIVGRNLKIQ